MRNTCGEWRKKYGFKPTTENCNCNWKPTVWTRQTLDACAKGDARLILLAANCPTDYINDLRARHPEVTVHQAPIVNRELGVACGKPFSISTICVLDAGDSDLLQLDDNIA